MSPQWYQLNLTRPDAVACGVKSRPPPYWALLFSFGVFACEPDGFLGADDQGNTASMGGTDSIEHSDHTSGGQSSESRVVSNRGGSLGDNSEGDSKFIQGHECSVTHPGESHEEPIAVCCAMNDVEAAWRDDVIAEINAVRVEAGLEPFERDPHLDQAATAWALHWHLHWDPVEGEGYPVNYTVPSEVAAACGTTASTLVMSNAQAEMRLPNGLIDPSFPAARWETGRSFNILEPEHVRIGIGFYDGLLLGLFDEDPEPE